MKCMRLGKCFVLLIIGISLGTQPLHATPTDPADTVQTSLSLVAPFIYVLQRAGIIKSSDPALVNTTRALIVAPPPSPLSFPHSHTYSSSDLVVAPIATPPAPAAPEIAVAVPTIIPSISTDLVPVSQNQKKKFADIGARTKVILTLGPLFMAAFIFLPRHYSSALLATILLYILAKEWPQFKNDERPQFEKWRRALTPVYPVLPFALLTYLNQQPEYHNLVPYIFAAVFANDICAYLAGSAFGNTKIAPSISPKKSWEGAAGGLVGVTITLQAITALTNTPLDRATLLTLATTISTADTVGDFFKSWLKRQAKLKDSGNLLPGHGGLLDRFDSAMAVGCLFFVFRNKLAPLLLNHEGGFMRQIEGA